MRVEVHEDDSSLGQQQEEWDLEDVSRVDSLVDEAASQVAADVSGDDKGDMNVMMWNCSGWRLSKTHAQKVLADHFVNVMALNETWWYYDINQYPYEVHNEAREPYQATANEYARGRPSGGTYIGSNVPAYKFKELPGMVKCVCNGIFFINIYLNRENEVHIHKYWKYIRSLINLNKRVCVMGDFNRYKQDNIRILTQMGMIKVNEKDNFVADTRAAPTWHFNNQIFVYRLEAEMVNEYPKLNHEYHHESNHSILIFKIKKQLPKLKTECLMVPDKEEDRINFANKVKELIDKGVGTRIDVLYNAIRSASRELGLIKTTYGFRKLKFYWSKDDYDTYKSMIFEAYSYKGIDTATYLSLKREARLFWMSMKQKYWSEFVEKCVGQRRHFALINLLTRRGNIWVNYSPLVTCREKRPTITDNLENTQLIWRNYYELQYKLDNMADIPHLLGRVPAAGVDEQYAATTADVTEVLSHKRGRSSPGPSGIRYEHLKLVNSVCPEFMTDFVNEQLRNQWAPDQWEKCTVIPLYKANKMGEVTDPSSFRSVVLQESSMKLVESVWIYMKKEKIEFEAGPNQTAYKSKHGVFTSIYKLNNHIKDVEHGLIYFFDIKKAFGSCNRKRAFADLEMKFPGDPFIRKLHRCYNNLKMDVSLGFTNIEKIPYLRGFPEGSCTGAYLFVVMLNTVVQYVLDREPNARLVLYSDDIACIAGSVDELQRVYTLLSEGLRYFNMTFDATKAQFIRLGHFDIETISLKDLDGNFQTIDYSKSVRYLGFFIKDKEGIVLEHHLAERCNEQARKKEEGVLKWCSRNFYFNNLVRRSILLTRSVPKLYFGVQGIIECTEHSIFKATYVRTGIQNDKLIDKLHPYWVKYSGMDEHNLGLSNLGKVLTKGMTVPLMAAAFYWLKPLHAIGLKTRMVDIREYWLRLAMPRHKFLVKYFRANIHTINTINFRKCRLPNVHLLTALLCGHYSIWKRSAGYRTKRTLGWNCPRCMRPYTDSNYNQNDECVCSLAIPGQVPPDYPWTEEHRTFLRWLNKLSTHEMFEGWRKDAVWRPSAVAECGDNEFEYDGSSECIVAFTDGSFDDGKAGWGVFFDPDTCAKESHCGRSPGPQTNNRAELYAILRSLELTMYENRHIHIHSDSSYSLYTISMYIRRYLRNNVDAGRIKLKNLDLIKRISDNIYMRKPYKVFMTKVQAHCGIFGNECADWLSKSGRELGIPMLDDLEYDYDRDYDV